LSVVDARLTWKLMLTGVGIAWQINLSVWCLTLYVLEILSLLAFQPA